MQHPTPTQISAKAVAKAKNIPVALANFDFLPNSANVRLPVVAGLFSCSRATVWRMARDGRIPAPKKLSIRVTAWNVGDLRSSLARVAA